MQNKKHLPQISPSKYSLNVTAGLWGFAEATAFFIVPDVFITYRALKGYKAGFVACLYALLGALIGGSLVFVWASYSTAPLHFVQQIPGITPHMAVLANADYAHHGVVALLIAPLREIPYKLYAVIAPSHEISYLPFLLVSFIARLSRFVLVSVIAATISTGLKSQLSYKQKLGLHIGFWIIFYIVYFYLNRE